MGLVNTLLLEKIPLAGIARVTQVSESWLQEHVNDADAKVARTASVLPKGKGKLTVQMDELWSFVDDKGNQQWVWLAMDADTREIIGVMSVFVRGVPHVSYGSRYRRYTVNVPKSMPTIGMPMQRSFPASATLQSAKRVG